jgi:enoyl-CoA hydratase
VVPKGTARQAAQELARQLAAFPQICLRNDRLSVYEQFDLSFEEALANEFQHGLKAIEQEAPKGAARFYEGSGRHGEFEK